MVDVSEPLPEDQLLTPAESEPDLQGAHNEENRKLDTRPPEYIIILFPFTVAHYKVRRKTLLPGCSSPRVRVSRGLFSESLMFYWLSVPSADKF